MKYAAIPIAPTKVTKLGELSTDELAIIFPGFLVCLLGALVELSNGDLVELEGCLVDAVGCFVDAEGCFVDVEGCRVDAEGCLVDFEGFFVDVDDSKGIFVDIAEGDFVDFITLVRRTTVLLIFLRGTLSALQSCDAQEANIRTAMISLLYMFCSMLNVPCEL